MKHLIIFLLLLVPNCHCECNWYNVIDNEFTDLEREYIVHKHNTFRKLIARGRVENQPKSSNMLRMMWDEDLADEAQIIADTCNFEHVKVDDDRFPVGQNLFWSGSSMESVEANWRQAITEWFNEHTTYTFGSTQYNHYTQVVWAETYLVGCGYIHYKVRGLHQKLYVCNYGPAGNFLGEKPYLVGAGCSNLC